MKQTKQKLILTAYEILQDATPKKYDCGKICNSACCKENNSHNGQRYGMLLLPGEEKILDIIEGFEIKKTQNETLLTCSGTCNRAFRPFSCRIFPFYPKIEKKGERYTIKIKPDPRSFMVCPICSDFRNRKANIYFLRQAKKAVRILIKNKEILDELIAQSDMITEIQEFRNKLFSK